MVDDEDMFGVKLGDEVVGVGVMIGWWGLKKVGEVLVCLVGVVVGLGLGKVFGC